MVPISFSAEGEESMRNLCKYRNREEGVCEKNGQDCPVYIQDNDDMPCGGCCYCEDSENKET
jgi:hypothetical protein